MKRFVILLVCFLSATCFYAQSTFFIDVPQMGNTIPNKDAKFELYSTTDVNAFLKLDTSTGEIWLVLIGLVNNIEKEIKFSSSCYPIEIDGEKTNGRFTLYPTHNKYFFLLIDKIDGRVWRVQWDSSILGYKEENRVISRIK